MCLKERNIDHQLEQCKCIRCGETHHSFTYIDDYTTDLQECKGCGMYRIVSRRVDDKSYLDMLETIIKKHGEDLDKIFFRDEIDKLITFSGKEKPRADEILDSLLQKNCQRDLIMSLRARKPQRACHNIEEMNVNSDEGWYGYSILHGKKN